jgi:ABC-type sugar transport system ATPase subunit
MPALVSMRGITKHFGGVQALKGVDLELFAGEITCLLGENGAGKSTLMKILCGALRQDTGGIEWQGHPRVGMVFQEFNLCSNLSVAENMALGAEPSNALGALDRQAMRANASAALAELGLALDLDRPVGTLGTAEQQMVEIAKALAGKPSLLILDEPTSALSGHEIQRLFTVLRGLKVQGLAMVYISHKLSEIRELCDRVVCLKDGENSGQADPKTTSETQLVAMLVGRELKAAPARATALQGQPLLSLRGISGEPGIRDVSLDLRAGEILGLAGLMGAGRSELARLIMGVTRREAGSMTLDGQSFDPQDPSQAVAAGVAYVPEDRKADGLVRDLAVSGHVALAASRSLAGSLGIFRPGRVLALSRRYIRRLQVKASPETDAFALSGGNQQKVVLARALAGKPRVLILDEPTRGVDVGAKVEIHRLIRGLADKGLAVLLISSELPEILALSDRVLVMRGGQIRAELAREALSEEAVMQAAFG